MKKIMFVIPLMAISFLASCGNKSQTYTITYENLFNATTDNPTSYTTNDTIVFKNPTDRGYDFTGWHLNSEEGEIISELPKSTTGNLTLYASWGELTSYDITYLNMEGVAHANPLTYTIESAVNLQNPTGIKVGYGNFDHWEINGASVTGWQPGEKMGPITVTAFWSNPTTYTITYILDGGTDPGNPANYTINDKVTLTVPEQEGFTFSGWYLAPIERNPLGGNGWEPGERTGNITLYADWHEANQTLNDHAWKEISDISANKLASKYFNIGETKTILMKDDEKQKIFDLRIIDYNRDFLPGVANTAGITFDFVDTINHPVSWGNNSREFTNSPLYECLNQGGDIYKMIETVIDISGKLIDFVKTVKKSYSHISETHWVDGEYETKLFPLSQVEMGYDGTYKYYEDDSKNKRKKNSSYWLRTPSGDAGDYAASCNLDGSIALFTGCSTSLNVAPGFCI